jgi:hypothetical protein
VLVPQLAPAAVWQGPELPESSSSTAADPQLTQLASSLLDMDVTTEAAADRAGAFARSVGENERTQRVGGLVVTFVEMANDHRARLIDGIKRFARKQRALAGHIKAETNKLRDLEAQGSQAASAESGDVREAWSWDMRVYDERQRSLTYMCEQPVSLDQRVFALSRALSSALQ